MKKFLFVIAVLSLIFSSLWSCSENTPEILEIQNFRVTDIVDLKYMPDSTKNTLHYTVKGKKKIHIFIGKSLCYPAVPEVTNRFYKEVMMSDSLESESEELKINDYEISCYTANIDHAEQKLDRSSIYTFFKGTSGLSIIVEYPEKLEADARERAERLIENIEFIGEEDTSTGIRDIGNDIFSIPADRNWYISSENKSKIKIQYAMAENLSQLLSNVEVRFYVNSIYDTAEEYLRSSMDNKSYQEENGSITFTEQPYETEIFGCPAMAFEYERNSDMFGLDDVTEYYAKKDDMIFSVKVQINNKDEPEAAAEDIRSLLADITVNEITDEIKAKYTKQYETEHYKYSLPSYFFYLDKVEDPFFSGMGRRIEISENSGDNVLSVDEWKSPKADMFTGMEWEKVYRTIEVGGRKFHYLSVIYEEDTVEKVKDHLYFMTGDEDKQLLISLEWDLDCNEDVFDKKFIMALLESIEDI